MPIIQINNKKIHVLEMNETASETIVMVHGMFTNLSVFYFKIAPEISKKYRIVMYDLQSHGLSECVDTGYDLKSMTEDMIALMDTLSIPKAHIVGYSFGGLIALYAALHYPDRLNRLAVIESPNPNDEEPHKLLQKYNKEYLEQYVENLAKSTGMRPSKRQMEKNHKLNEYLFNNTTIVEDMLLYRDFFSNELISTIGHDTLLLYGNRSDCLRASEFLNRNIKGSQLFIGEGDHNIPVQNSSWIVEKLNSFY